MSYVVALVIIVVESFLLGSIPCGVIVGRVSGAGDPRQGGSGSIGTTNMIRQFGWKAGIITFLGDVLKGVAAVLICRLVMEHTPYVNEWQGDLLLVLSVACVIFGHMFSPWLGFHGGKGIATGFGSILAAYPPIAAAILVVFIVFVAITRIVSVGSIFAAITVPIAACIFYWGHVPTIVLSLVIAIGVVYAHRANVGRLRRGEEPKFSVGHKK